MLVFHSNWMCCFAAPFYAVDFESPVIARTAIIVMLIVHWFKKIFKVGNI